MRQTLIVFLLFLTPFHLVGWAMLAYSFSLFLQSQRVARWPTVVGRISECVLQEPIAEESEDAVWGVTVVYDYSVDGVIYTNDQIAIGYAPSADRTSQRSLFAKLKNCKSVTVRYDQDQPANSYLSCGVNHRIAYWLAFSIFWSLFVAGFTVVVWVYFTPEKNLMRQILTQ